MLSISEFARERGHFCPACRSIDLESLSKHWCIHPNRICQLRAGCNSCGASWNEIYKRVYRLVGYTDLVKKIRLMD